MSTAHRACQGSSPLSAWTWLEACWDSLTGQHCVGTAAHQLKELGLLCYRTCYFSCDALKTELCCFLSPIPEISCCHPLHDARLALRFHCWVDFSQFKGKLSSASSQSTLWFSNQAVPLVLVFYFGGSHEYMYLPCSEFAWGESVWVTEHLDCVWYKKLNFFHSTQWVKVWGNFISGSLWKMLFYPTMCEDGPSSVCCGFIF